MSARAATFWTFVVTSVAVFMVSLDNLVVTTALPVIKADLGASLQGLEWTVNAYTLDLRRLAPDRRRAGRPVRAQADVPGGSCDLHGRLRGGGARAEHRRAGRRPGPAGRRRRDRHAAHPDDPLRGRAAGPPRHGARHLGRRQRPRRRARPGGRRRDRRGSLLAVDLLAQRPDRPRAAADRSDPPVRVQGPEPLARPARPGPRQRRPARHRLGPGPRQRARLDEPRRRRPHRRRHRPAGRVRPLGASHAGADGAAALLPQPRLLGGQRHLAADELRDVRLDLPAGAVLPGGAGLLAARGGHPHAAVDGDADLRRARSPACSATASAPVRCWSPAWR